MRSVLILILILLVLPSVNAISTNMKNVYQPGETAIFKISGNILEPIFPKDIKFLRGHVEVPFDYDIKKMNSEYYVYAIMPLLDLGVNESKTYDFLINDLATTEFGKNVKIDFRQNFSVSGELIDYTINPGFVVSSDNFDLEITLNKDLNEPITIDFPEEKEIILKPGENKIKFDVSNVDGGFYEINVGNYVVPINLVKEIKKRQNVMKFIPFEINKVVLTGNEENYQFSIINTGREDVENVSLEYDSNLFQITPEIPELFKAGENYKFELGTKRVEDVDELILLDYNNDSVGFQIKISYTENKSEVNNVVENKSIDGGYYCSELNGKKCSSEETCSTDVVSSRDVNECCVGACIKNSSGSKSWIGYLIGFVLLLVLIVIGIKYRKSKKKKDIFGKKVKQAEKKILPSF